MKPKTKSIDFGKEVFNINKPMRKGDWWYWLWLFFFDDPKTKKPRQLMVLWSSKNEKEIECNENRFKLHNPKAGNMLKGVVASWYFDGERMHENLILEGCDIRFLKQSMEAYSSVPTSFRVERNQSIIKIGSDFKFIAAEGVDEFLRAKREEVRYPGNSGYSMIESKQMKLKGTVKGEAVEGSAYFQRVFLSGLYPSWYWGVFNFENGGNMIYFYPYIIAKPLKRNIDFVTFFDGKKVHNFDHVKIKMIGGKKSPLFKVCSESPKESIDFMVRTYSHASWAFKKRYVGIIPKKLTYNEYPSVITSFSLVDKITGKKISLKDVGDSTGNVEYGEGFLL